MTVIAFFIFIFYIYLFIFFFFNRKLDAVMN